MNPGEQIDKFIRPTRQVSPYISNAIFNNFYSAGNLMVTDMRLDKCHYIGSQDLFYYHVYMYISL